MQRDTEHSMRRTPKYKILAMPTFSVNLFSFIPREEKWAGVGGMGGGGGGGKDADGTNGRLLAQTADCWGTLRQRQGVGGRGVCVWGGGQGRGGGGG